MRFQYVAQDELKYKILLPQSTKGWGHMGVLSHKACVLFLDMLVCSSMAVLSHPWE